MIVKQKQNGRQNPGHRIIEERYGERREEGDHSENPYHTEQADTAGCDEHRNDDVAHAAQRTGEDLGKDEQPVKRSHGCEFPYKSRVMGTSEPLKPLKAPYMARNPVKWGFFRLKGQEIPLKI